MANHIVLIGPVASGKSSVSECLSRCLHLPRISLDDSVYYRKIFREAGYDEAYAGVLREKDWKEYLLYREPFYLLLIEKALSMPVDHVIDFGAPHSVLFGKGNPERLSMLMAPVKDIILLLPVEDVERTKVILLERKTKDYPLDEEAFLALNDRFLKSDANKQLAKRTVYTYDRTPKQVCKLILSLLDR